jgi:hypothetical protein
MYGVYETSSFVIPRYPRLRSIVTHNDDAPGCRDERWMRPDDGTAPHVSSGGELSAVPGMICLFNLPGWFVAQGRVYIMLVVILDFGHFSRNQRAMDVPASALWTPSLGSLRTDDSRSARNQQGMGPEIDELFRQQANERDSTKREAILHQIQRIIQEKALFVPNWQLAFLSGVGPRIAEPGIGLIPLYIYSAPYEDVRLK